MSDWSGASCVDLKSHTANGSQAGRKEDNKDTFRILIATDNHLGYAEKDGVRSKDSFMTFEEILQHARRLGVDFILLGGDIFHDSRPSLSCIHETVRLLKHYCLGSRPVTFDLLSDQAKLFASTSSPQVNYLDPNLNVSIPVFTIHGNHDDPSGPGGLCAADLLHTAGLVNLFGKSTSVERIDLSPLLMRKGSTKLAIYGLGAVREERLHRLFLNNLVQFLRPSEQTDDWFSTAVVHQNRVRHGRTNYLDESFLPDFLDLVIWGHEHDCRLEPEWNSTQNFFVVQPGSSIATSLSEGESLPKAIGLCEIRGKEFKITRIPLTTIRPFLFKDVVVQDELSFERTSGDNKSDDSSCKVERLCTLLIESFIRQAVGATQAALSSGNDQHHQLRPPVEPLIRLRVDLSGGFDTFSRLRFGQKFVGRVANAKDLVTFNYNRDRLAKAQSDRALTSGLASSSSATQGDAAVPSDVGMDSVQVDKLVRHFLASSSTCVDSSTNGLTTFTLAELGHGLKAFINCNEARDAIHTVVGKVVDNVVCHLKVRQCDEHLVPDEIVDYCKKRTNRQSNDADSGDRDGLIDDDLLSTLDSKAPADKSTKTSGRSAASTVVASKVNTARRSIRDVGWSSSDSSDEGNASSVTKPKSRKCSTRQRTVHQHESDNDDQLDICEESDDDANIIGTTATSLRGSRRGGRRGGRTGRGSMLSFVDSTSSQLSTAESAPTRSRGRGRPRAGRRRG